jgi:hypothetical protein
MRLSTQAVQVEIDGPGPLSFWQTVRFSGKVHYSPGQWLGLELDEPNGRNNGTVKVNAT